MLDRLQHVFKFLNCNDVKYVVIGGIAAGLYGVPRTTFDLDILIEATPENAKLLLEAFLSAQLGTAALTTPEQLLANEISIFRDIVHIDVMTTTPGLSFEDAWRDRETMSYQGQSFFVVSRDHLIASKRAAGRPVDLDDIRALQAGDSSEET